jgi:hypothetical protein
MSKAFKGSVLPGDAKATSAQHASRVENVPRTLAKRDFALRGAYTETTLALPCVRARSDPMNAPFSVQFDKN